MSPTLPSLILVVAAGLFVGCDDTTLGRFTVDEPIPETRVEGGGFITLLPAALDPFDVDLTSSEEFERQDFDYLTSVRLDSLYFEIDATSMDPADDPAEDGMADNFDFFSAISLSIVATIDGVERRALIASLPEGDVQFSSARQRIDLVTTGIDILAFVEAEGGYRIESEVSGRAPPDTVIFGGESSYRVGVGFR